MIIFIRNNILYHIQYKSHQIQTTCNKNHIQWISSTIKIISYFISFWKIYPIHYYYLQQTLQNTVISIRRVMKLIYRIWIYVWLLSFLIKEFKFLTFLELDCGPWSHSECPVNIPAVYCVGQAIPIQVRTGQGLYLNMNK